MFTIWKRAITPGLTPDKVMATYEALLQEEPNPTLGKGLLWMVISAVLAAVVDGVAGLGLGLVLSAPLEEVVVAALSGLISMPIIALLSYAVSVVALFAAARVLGGQGTLNQQAYLQAALQAPLIVINTVVTIGIQVLALLGGVFTFAGLLYFPLGIYFGWLGLVILRVPHRYSGGKAFFTALLAGLFMLPLFFCAGSILGPLFQG